MEADDSPGVQVSDRSGNRETDRRSAADIHRNFEPLLTDPLEELEKTVSGRKTD